MMRLAFSLRGLDTSRIVFTTAPYLGTGSVDGQSIVRLNESLGRGFWLAFGYDTLPAFMRAHVLHRSAHRRLDTTVPAAGCRSCAEHGPAPPVAGHSAPWGDTVG